MDEAVLALMMVGATCSVKVSDAPGASETQSDCEPP